MVTSINGGFKHIKQNRTFSKIGEGDFRYFSNIQTTALWENNNKNHSDHGMMI